MSENNFLQFILHFLISLLIACIVYNHYKRITYRSHLKYSTFWPRFWAPSVDSIVLWPFLTLIPHLLSFVFPSFLNTFINIIVNILHLVYSIYFHGTYGATIGKMACKVKIVDAKTEKPITMRQAVLRDSVPIVLTIYLYGYLGIQRDFETNTTTVSFYVFLMVYLWFFAEIVTMLTNEKRRAIHDFIAGTVVIRTNIDSN